MKRIAICIPTFNRAKVIKDICMKIEKTMYINFFDIYIYDSSSNQDTKKELQYIMESDNFYYIKVDSKVHSSKKVYDIYQNEMIQNEYKYLWILPDYLFFSESVIEWVIEKTSEKWDMIMLDFYDPDIRGNRQYINPNEIFFEFAWSLTQFGILLLNCETVLKKANWSYLEKKYLNVKYRNFSHILMYFELMLQIDNLRFFHFSVSPTDVYRSKYRRMQSEYFKDYLQVWGECWYESICALPDYYRNKNKVIKKACIYTHNLSMQNLAELRKQGVLVPRTFNKYIKIWNTVSTVPVFEVWMLLNSPHFIVNLIAEYGSLKEGVCQAFWLMRIKIFCKVHNKIYLYGAGVVAERIADYLNKKSIPFEGFVVTNLKGNKKFLKGHKVIELSDIGDRFDIGIVIALNEQNRKEVIPLLNKRGYKYLF